MSTQSCSWDKCKYDENDDNDGDNDADDDDDNDALSSSSNDEQRCVDDDQTAMTFFSTSGERSMGKRHGESSHTDTDLHADVRLLHTNGNKSSEKRITYVVLSVQHFPVTQYHPLIQ